MDPNELAGGELFASLPSSARETLASRARRRRYRQLELVLEEGGPPDSVHVVTEGLLKVVRPTQGVDLVLQFLKPGHTFGELAVLNAAPRLASVVAVVESETIEIQAADFDEVLADHPEAMRRMLAALATSLTLTKEDIARQNQALEQKVQARTRELVEAQLELVTRLGQAVESRDGSTGLHITRISRMASRLARVAGLSPEESEALLHAAPLHDLGKIGIPDYILFKAGPLDAAEWEVMKRHTTIGAKMLEGSRSPILQLAETLARTHHERWDGSGYPEGLAGEEIPLVGRICGICDAFDALVHERPYKPAWEVGEALAEIDRSAGSAFDPSLVRLFVHHFPDLAL